jgi:hypothetical protein
MAWFQDHLYVGTLRNILALVKASPPKYPAGMIPWPVRVPENVFTLDLRAQIWRYDPATGRWDQAYVSPMMPGPDGKPVPRDIGYRCMAVFQGPEDSEPALYIATASSNTRGPGAHVLRLTETGGVITASPPGLGDQNVSTLRALVAFQGRLYTAPTGSGRAWNAADRPCVYESVDPIAGKWRPVSQPHFGDGTNDAIYEMAVFNDHLYVGTLNPTSGYQIWKVRPIGEPPYAWKKVLGLGAFRGSLNEAAMTMCVFGDALYVGSGISNGGYDRTYKVGPGAGEVIRIYSDDSWDIVVGASRDTPWGQKRPLSGMRPGFNNPCAGYIWSMAVYDGWLYVGTFDSTILALWADPKLQPKRRQLTFRMMGVDGVVERGGGFNLWRSYDGVHWTAVTQNGFDNLYNYGVRTMLSTPAGLFVGTANPFGPEVAARLAGGWKYVANPRGGAEVWLGSAKRGEALRDEMEPSGPQQQTSGDFIVVSDSSASTRDGGSLGEASMDLGPPPEHVDRSRLLAELEAAEHDWRAAARRATEASFAYHYIRVLGALARRTLVSETSQGNVPAWAVAIRQWEGALGDGAARRAGLEAIRASRNYHLASARRELVRWALADSEEKREASGRKYQHHLKSARRASKRLMKARTTNSAAKGPNP